MNRVRRTGKPLRFRAQLARRRRKILLHPNSLFALLAGVIYATLSSIRSTLAPAERPTVEELASGVFALAGFGFSVALAAVAIVVALPRSRLLLNMLNEEKGSEEPSAYSDLVFLFAWTGIVQGTAAGSAIVGLVLGGKSVLLTRDDTLGLLFGCALIVASTYALLQLMTAVVTISQIALLQAEYYRADQKLQGEDSREAPGELGSRMPMHTPAPDPRDGAAGPGADDRPAD